MTIKKSEKNLGGMMDSNLVEEFTSQVDDRGSKIKRSLVAAVKLWIELPAEIQALLLNQSLDANSFVSLIQEIVDERINAGRKSARKLLSHQHKKRDKKGQVDH